MTPATRTASSSNASSSVASPGAPLRIAVVGCGPRGMYCLECLAMELEQLPVLNAIEITVYEPCRYPGAGPIYDPTQPHYLRMNFASRHINAWSDDDGDKSGDVRPSLVRWLARHHPALADPEAYIPRAVVGEYLHWCFQQIVRSLDGRAKLRMIPRRPPPSTGRTGNGESARRSARENLTKF